MSIPLHVIAAVCNNGGIGKHNDLPWKLKEEFNHFCRVTGLTHDKNKVNAVVMGRKTWESLPPNCKPLKHRINVILSHTIEEPPNGVNIVAKSLDEALETLTNPPYDSQIETIYAIGGHNVYKAALESDKFQRMYLTRIIKDYDCDTFFPNFNPQDFKLGKCPKVPDIFLDGIREDGIDWKVEIYDKI